MAVSQALDLRPRKKPSTSQLSLLNRVSKDLSLALDVFQIVERVTGPDPQRTRLL